MPTLHDVQQAFARAVWSGELAEAADLIQADVFQPEQRLQLYRNNFNISLREALRAVYPTIVRLVGDDFFATVARALVREAPPRSGNLHDFGAELPAFLRHFKHAAALPYLPDVARIDWACHQAFHAAEAPGFDFSSLATVPVERYGRLRFHLQPALRLMASEFPSVRIWEVNQPGGNGDQRIDLRSGAQRAVIARIARQVAVEAAAAGRFEFLRALSHGAVLDQAAEAALIADPEFDLGLELRHLVSQQVIGGFEQ